MLTGVPCQICVSNMLVWDDDLDDFSCPKCGPKRCLVPYCFNHATMGAIGCPEHTCSFHKECSVFENGDLMFINGTLHTTNLPSEQQIIIDLRWGVRSIMCPRDARFCKVLEMGRKQHIHCQPVYGYNDDKHPGLCFPCWQGNMCRGHDCNEMATETGFCAGGAGKCFATKSCDCCTLELCYVKQNNIGVFDKAPRFCSDCNKTQLTCSSCNRFGAKQGCTIFSKYVYGNRDLYACSIKTNCIYCIVENGNKKTGRFYKAAMIAWRLMVMAVKHVIQRKAGDSERLSYQEALCYEMNKEFITQCDVDELVHNLDVEPVLKRIRLKAEETPSVFSLMLGVASLPLPAFLRILLEFS